MAEPAEKVAAQVVDAQERAYASSAYHRARHEVFRDSMDYIRMGEYPYGILRERLKGLIDGAQETLQIINVADSE